jgi:peptidoglycan/LPS O-acetylase OafA/YrhL
MAIPNRRLIAILFAVTFILLIPFVSMQFTNEVNWTLSDFVIAGVLLLGTGLACELVIRNVKKINYRIAICAIILALLILTWIELAVGIFGTPFAGN